jgi:hypothetical protein
MGNIDIRKRLGTERMVEEIQEYRRKWRYRVERMPPQHLPWQAYFFIALLKDETVDVQEDGHNSSLSLDAGHDSVI